MSLEALKVNPDFKYYFKYLQKRFDDKYKLLRTAKTVEQIREIEGYLQGIEYALNLIDLETEAEQGHNP